MNKVEKIFDSYKGLVLFYICVAVLSFLITKKIEKINIINAEVKVERASCYA